MRKKAPYIEKVFSKRRINKAPEKEKKGRQHGDKAPIRGFLNYFPGGANVYSSPSPCERLWADERE